MNGGRIRVCLLADEAFEQGRPDLVDQMAKRRKQIGYYLARTEGEE